MSSHVYFFNRFDVCIFGFCFLIIPIVFLYLSLFHSISLFLHIFPWPTLSLYPSLSLVLAIFLLLFSLPFLSVVSSSPPLSPSCSLSFPFPGVRFSPFFISLFLSHVLSPYLFLPHPLSLLFPALLSHPFFLYITIASYLSLSCSLSLPFPGHSPSSPFHGHSSSLPSSISLFPLPFCPVLSPSLSLTYTRPLPLSISRFLFTFFYLTFSPYLSLPQTPSLPGLPHSPSHPSFLKDPIRFISLVGFPPPPPPPPFLTMSLPL